MTIGVSQSLFLSRPKPTHLHKVSRQGQDSPGSLIPTDQGPVGPGRGGGWVGVCGVQGVAARLGTLIDICILLCG